MWLRRRRLRTFLVDSDGDEEIAVVPSDDSPEEDAVPLEEEATSPQSARATPQTPSTEELRAVQSKLEALKEALVKRIEATAFPLNPLDELIDRLGGESRVAEMTGRTHRVLHHRPGVRDSSTAYLEEKGAARPEEEYFYYESRGVRRGSEEGANMVEKNRFQSGEKRVAVISEAASAGISLHSDRRVRNQAKRIHIILELPWSAEKVIQQCGRSHRSNQRVPPDYVFLLSSIGGELRFVSTLSKRLRAMGALTQGSRKATGALQFDQFDFNSSYGKKAVALMVRTVFAAQEDAKEVVVQGEQVYEPGTYEWARRADVRRSEALPAMDAAEKEAFEAYKTEACAGRLYRMRQWLESVGFHPDKTDLTAFFFNRLLGLPLFQQTLFVRYLNEVGVVVGDEA